MSGQHFVLFRLDDQHLVIPLESTLYIARAVAVTPLPNAPEVVEGLIDFQGEIIPVIDMRKRLGFESRPLDPEDHFLIADTPHRTMALHVDEVLDLIESPEESVFEEREILPGVDKFLGVVKREQGLLLIQDLERLLSFDETEQLTHSLNRVEVKT